MKKLLIVLLIFVSCSKDEGIDCQALKNEIYQEYFDKIKAETDTNNTKVTFRFSGVTTRS